MTAQLLQKSQYCGVERNNIFEAVATCERRLQGRGKARAVLVLSLDFQEAFDRISHHYLFNILRSHGFSNWFVERIKRIYDEAGSSVQPNGHIA